MCPSLNRCYVLALPARGAPNYSGMRIHALGADTICSRTHRVRGAHDRGITFLAH